jgi:hypothetical protein
MVAADLRLLERGIIPFVPKKKAQGVSPGLNPPMEEVEETSGGPLAQGR